MEKVNLQKQYGLFIDGEWKDASDGGLFKSYSPATGEMLAEIAEATKEDVDLAVAAAHKALPSWSKTSPIERQNLLLKIADIIDANAKHLAMVETLDNGKPIRENKYGRYTDECRSLPLLCRSYTCRRRNCNNA